MEVMNEYVEDVMNADEEQIEDEDVNKLIGDMEHEAVAKQKKKVQMDLDEYENQLDDI